jgi:glycosyltransferase involved in cell wall biosynthesis
MKVVICWMNFSGYSAACWRSLARHPDIDLHVVCLAPHASGGDTEFRRESLREVSHHFLEGSISADAAAVERHVVSQRPDVILVTGWAHRPYCDLTRSPQLSATKFVLGMDTPWRGDIRQRLGRIYLRPYVHRMAASFVAGERARRYAVRLGIPESKIVKGLYAFDCDLFNESVFRQRLQNHAPWPRRFLFAGRYVPEKAFDVLLEGYRRYRAASAAPWPLKCCGRGAMQSMLANMDGVSDLGFVQPIHQPDVFAECGVFVLPSRYEPWGVAMAEAMGTGMPVIATSACGAGVELLHPYFNGLEIPPDDPAALAEAMAWMERHHERLPDLGKNALYVARAYSADLWAERALDVFRLALGVRLGT